MASFINFEIPQNPLELLEDTVERYFVRAVVVVKEIQSALDTAKMCFREQGPEYILENFDVYYSLIHYSAELKKHVVFVGYEHLHRAVQDLHKGLLYLLGDQENLTDEVKTKYRNVTKMLLYAYVNVIVTIEQNNENERTQTLTVEKSRKKQNNDGKNFTINRNGVLTAITNLLEQELKTLWDPPVIEESFVKMVSEVCYKFLEIPAIKGEKEVLLGIWTMLGLLITKMNHGVAFIVRIVQLIKTHEHMAAFAAEGVKQIVDGNKCKSLVRDLIREITEWQCEETFTDTQGTRNCSKVVSDMATVMPELLLDEVAYITQYLWHESYSLRNCALNVIVQVIQIVLTKTELSEEERETRDELLGVLEEHIVDISPYVRSRVFGHWKTLHQENAIPVSMQTGILEKAVNHLQDKSAAVRKCAANCVTAFLEHNIFASELSLKKYKKELDDTAKKINELSLELEEYEGKKVKELEKEWSKHEKAVMEALQNDTDELMEEDDIDSNSFAQIIRDAVRAREYEKVSTFARITSKKGNMFKNPENKIKEADKMQMLLFLVKSIFCNVKDHVLETPERNKCGPALCEKFEQLTVLGKTKEYLTTVVGFSEQIDRARASMKDLLLSVNMGDMQEAVDFFVAAFKFNIDHAHIDILHLLTIMQRPEADRRMCVQDALKLVFLTSEAKSSSEHAVHVIDGLLNFVKVVPYDKKSNLTLLISEWTAKGILDNTIIDMLWQYVTKKSDVSDENSRAALYMLTMAAQGRRTIITRNIKLVSTIAFGERGQTDLLLATQGCEMLSIVGLEKQQLTDENPPFRVNINDEMWQQLGDILFAVFTKKVKFVNNFISAAIEVIYRLCSMPIKLCQDLVKALLAKVAEMEGVTLPVYVIVRYCVLLGQIAVRHLNYLDETVYKELKRRNYVRDKQKEQSEAPKKKKRGRNATSNSLLGTSTDVDDGAVMEGAQADDADAEFISNILNFKTVTGDSGLGRLSKVIISVCEQPNIYDDGNMQFAAVVALIRFMLVSDVFCRKYVPLVFTILEKTPHENVKVGILVLCSDLLERFPNVIEPFTPKIFQRLEDSSVDVRATTFYMLSNLILRDMIRAQGYISQMAKSIVDKEKRMVDMAKDFFVKLSHMGNNLYNVLPDIFSHLVEIVSEEELRAVMRILFGLIDKNKLMENLVDRFCAKFKLTENELILRNIAYCLTLINYNEKGLKKLIQNFVHYKHLILVKDIFLLFKQITSSCSKGPAKAESIKALATELDEKMKEMFKLNKNGNSPAPDIRKKRQKKKNLKSRDTESRDGTTTQNNRRKRYVDSDDSD